MTVILHVGQRNAAGNLIGMFVQGLELLSESEIPEASTLRMRIDGVGFNKLTKRRNFSSRDFV